MQNGSVLQQTRSRTIFQGSNNLTLQLLLPSITISPNFNRTNEAFLFLPAKSRAALGDLGNLVDAKIARLKQGASLETTRFRQAQFIKWCNQKLIPDPCGNEPGYERIVACFAENFMFDCNSCSATVQGYVESINKLFALRSFPIPADLKDKDIMVAKLIHAREREENISKQQSLLTKEMYVEMAKCAGASP